MFSIARLDSPTRLADALALLRDHPGARPLAGGTDVLVGLRDSMEPAHLVDILRLPELAAEYVDAGGTLRLGANLTFRRLIASPLARERVPLLAEAAATVAGPQIRAMATLGGNLCNGAVSADSAAPLLVLDAALRLVSLSGGNEMAERTLPLADFYLGPGRVALRPAELLAEIVIPPTPPSSGWAWSKYAMRAAMDIATIGCAVHLTLTDDPTPRIAALRLAFTVAAPTPVRCPRAEAAAPGLPATPASFAAIAEAALGDVSPRSSWRAEKDFRLHIIQTLAERLLHQAAEHARKTLDGAGKAR